MPSIALKDLHLAKSMKDLDSQTELESSIQKRATHLLVSSAGKVFQAAEHSFLEKDEEKAYLHYMRVVELILMLKKRPDFKKETNKNHKQLIEYANIAISKAEILKESLTKRYSINQEAVCRKTEKDSIIAELYKNKPEIVNNTEVLPDKSKDVEKLFISSTELHSLLTSNQSSVIIMDTRPASDFAESHIKDSHCINIPQEILIPGVTAAKLESLLPKESLSLWFRRSNIDWIVLIDWDCKDEITENVHLNALKTAMSKWDQKCVLKSNPVVLNGGYKDWMLKYPMYTTHTLNFDLLDDVQSLPVLADLSEIEYPNLDETVSDEVQLLNEKNSNNMLFKKTGIVNPIFSNGIPSASYPVGKKPFSAPAVDRRCKPSVDSISKSSSSELKFNKSTSNSASIRKNDSVFQEKKVPPPIDRKLKTLVLNPTTVQNDVDRDVLDSFNKEQSLARESLEIANKKLRKEEEFEKLRLRKALEAEESKRKEIQKKEESLINKIKQLELEKKEKEAAFLKAQEETAKYKMYLDEESYKEYKKEKEKELSGVYNENVVLAENIDRVKEERIKTEAENQKKKDTSNTSLDTISTNLSSKKSDHYSERPASSITNSSEYNVPLSRQSSSDSCSRGLVRSHSSPNIAQMVDEEEISLSKTPIIDRSLKPKITVNSQTSDKGRARIRNLNPVYGNCPVRSATGLRNLGNTCFMNSVIQCLSNTVPLAEFILSLQYVDHINRDNKQGTGGELIEEFAVVIKNLWTGQIKSISPRDFKNTVSRCLSVCIGNEQQDSHEFLVVLMEKLHADLMKKNMKTVPKLDPNCSEGTFWQHHKTYNSSKMSDIFEGMLKSTLTCLTCRTTSNSYEVTSCLSLPILASKCSLKDCFKNFLRPEKIYGEAAWDCPRCKQKKEAEKRLSICRVPEVLIIQLKRFSYEGLWRRKLQTHVDFDLSFNVPYEENCHEYSRLYSLYGVVNHYGTLEGGHYTAYCKNKSGKWFKYDDHEVSEISHSDIKTSAAYLLFYISSDFHSRL